MSNVQSCQLVSSARYFPVTGAKRDGLTRMGKPGKYVGTGMWFLSGATTWSLRDEKVFDVLQLVRYERRTSLSIFGCKVKAKATGVKDLLEF